MSCFTEFVWMTYLDGESLPGQAQELEQHLAECRRCRSLVESLREENEALAYLVQQTDDIPLFASTRPRRMRVLAALAWATLAALLLAAPFHVMTAFLPSGDWLNPLRPAGLFNLVFEMAFRLRKAEPFSLPAMASALVVPALCAALIAGFGRLRKRGGLTRVAFALIAVLSLQSRAMAKRTSDEVVLIPAQETLKDSLFAAGDTILIEGVIDGDLIAFGRTVEVRGAVKGDLIAWAQEVRVSGSVDGNLAGFAQVVSLSGHIGHNVYTWTQTLHLDRGSRIDASVLAGGRTVEVAGTVGRGVNCGSGTLIVSGDVGTDVHVQSGTAAFRAPARIDGDVTGYVDRRNGFRTEPGVSIRGKTDVHVRAETTRFMSLRFYIWKMIGLVAAILAGGLMMLLFPKLFDASIDSIRFWWRDFALGLAALVVVPISRELFSFRKPSRMRLFWSMAVGLIISSALLELPFGAGVVVEVAILGLGLGSLVSQLAARPPV